MLSEHALERPGQGVVDRAGEWRSPREFAITAGQNVSGAADRDCGMPLAGKSRRLALINVGARDCFLCVARASATCITGKRALPLIAG
jgi:hypothetical protein